MRHSFLFALIVPMVVAAGCQAKTETATSVETAQRAAPAPAAATTPPPAPAPAAPGEIGVAECDEFLRKWDACLSTKVTGERREQVKVAIDATRESWKLAASMPETKAGLAAACREASEIGSSQVKAYGCTW